MVNHTRRDNRLLYSPHHNNRKNTVIRNNDIAIFSEKRQIPQESKLRLVNFVVCKTVGEYNRNKRKIEKFCLAEKAQAAKTAQMEQPLKSSGKEAQSKQPPASET